MNNEKNQLDFSIIIPVFNEEKNILLLFDEIKKNLLSYNYEILFIDDYSTDKSIEIINKIKQDNKFIQLHKNNSNRGQSFSIYKGIKASKSNNIITIDADLQNDPKDISILFLKYINDPEVKLVSGVRIKRQDNFIKIISSKIANKIRSIYLGDKCPDTGCSLKVFEKKIIMHFEYFNGIHRFIPSLYEGIGCKVLYINVNHRHRKYGKSNYGISNRLFIGIKHLFQVKKILNEKDLND